MSKTGLNQSRKYLCWETRVEIFSERAVTVAQSTNCPEPTNLSSTMKNIINPRKGHFWRLFFAKPCFEKLNTRLFTFSLHGLGILNYENDLLTGEKHFLVYILPLYLDKEVNLFIDVGANTGKYSSLLLQTYKNCKVIAYEPNPKISSKLKTSLDSSRFTLREIALGSKSGRIQFFDRSDQDDGSEHGTIYKDVIEKIHQAESCSIEVEITTLDEDLHDLQTANVNLLKIDTEGHELEVLRGSSNLIKNRFVDIIHLEFNEMNIISKTFFREIQEILNEYIAYRLLPTGVIKLGTRPVRNELFAFQNLVFIHKKFKPDRNMKPTSVGQE